MPESQPVMTNKLFVFTLINPRLLIMISEILVLSNEIDGLFLFLECIRIDLLPST
jgi:hypothetical protein